jgi:hypothetical protein
MNDVVRQRLRDLIVEHGPALCEERLRCRSLLLDRCARQRRARKLLLLALDEGVADQLRQAHSGVPGTLLLERLTRHLVAEVALNEAAARWAVESWALALGVVTDADLGQPPETFLWGEWGYGTIRTAMAQAPYVCSRLGWRTLKILQIDVGVISSFSQKDEEPVGAIVLGGAVGALLCALINALRGKDFGGPILGAMLGALVGGFLGLLVQMAAQAIRQGYKATLIKATKVGTIVGVVLGIVGLVRGGSSVGGIVAMILCTACFGFLIGVFFSNAE